LLKGALAFLKGVFTLADVVHFSSQKKNGKEQGKRRRIKNKAIRERRNERARASDEEEVGEEAEGEKMGEKKKQTNKKWFLTSACRQKVAFIFPAE
jgi:hypothetical protein